jgi:hypothetical protein
MLNKTHIIHERNIIIPIKQNLSTSMKTSSPKGEYSLKQNFFDPTKSSPPNDFMLKLQMRMSIYNKPLHTCIKDDKRDSE